MKLLAQQSTNLGNVYSLLYSTGGILLQLMNDVMKEQRELPPDVPIPINRVVIDRLMLYCITRNFASLHAVSKLSDTSIVSLATNLMHNCFR